MSEQTPLWEDLSVVLSNINQTIETAKRIADEIARGTGGREISLCITKLEEARHRAIDAMMQLQSVEKDGA